MIELLVISSNLMVSDANFRLRSKPRPEPFAGANLCSFESRSRRG
jgi:hypothetical protein